MGKTIVRDKHKYSMVVSKTLEEFHIEHNLFLYAVPKYYLPDMKGKKHGWLVKRLKHNRF